ncbi:Prephenate dehydratase-domain-containing protein [Biscogniauxia marginata]|nr:Prephenate dehydratase-domain-containing protein [Biscogniauxia marginata]
MSEKGSSERKGDGDGPVESIRKPVVCFLGPISSYTHQATLQAFSADKYELMPVRTIKDIFDTTQSGRATYGVVPFENSTNGSVVFTLDHFADRSGLYPDLNVCREIYLDVHHCIVGYISPSPPPAASSLTTTTTSTSLPQTQSLLDNPSVSSPSPPSQSGQYTPTARDLSPPVPRSRPLHSLAHIQRLYSHPQAFGQCAQFLAAYLRGAETIDASSTSRAAELVKAEAESSPPGSSGPCAVAAISSAAAAELLGLDVLARDVEDRADNTTRFFVLRKGTEVGIPPSPPGEKRDEDDDGSDNTTTDPDPDSDSDDAILARTKSLVSFTVPHRSPGALADVLGCFRAAGLNLTSIGSRPRLAAAGDDDDDDGNGNENEEENEENEPFQYVFFIEFEGHRFEDPRRRVGDALAGVARVARAWRWLGSWRNERPRVRAKGDRRIGG